MTSSLGTTQPRVGTHRPWAVTAVVFLLAVALGVFADQGQRLSDPWDQLPELGTPWLLCGFAVSRAWAPRRAPALLTGIATSVVGLSSYFVFMQLAHDVSFYNLTNDGRGRFWYVLALATGVGAAVAGLLSRSPRAAARAIGWGLVPALPLAEIRYVAERGTESSALVALLVAAAVAAFWIAAWRCSPRSYLAIATTAWTCLGLLAVPIVLRLS